MKRGFGFRNLDFRGREAFLACAFLQPAREESLAAAILTTHGLECGRARHNACQLLLQRWGETVETDGKRIEASLRHSPAAKGVDNFLAAARTQSHGLPGLRGVEPELGSQQSKVNFHGFRLRIHGQHVVSVKV